MKTIKLTELDLNRIVKRVLSEQEEANYMFFSNLKQMKRQLEMIMEMDPSAVDHIIQNGHDWADDHISEAKTNIDQVFDFLKNEMDKESQYVDFEEMNEGKKKQVHPFVLEVRHQQKQNMTCIPQLIVIVMLYKYVKEKSKV